MKGRVGFWFHLERDTQKGEVLFKLYGQQCQRCPNADFSHAMWYPEEVVKVSVINYKHTPFDQKIQHSYNCLDLL